MHCSCARTDIGASLFLETAAWSQGLTWTFLVNSVSICILSSYSDWNELPCTIRRLFMRAAGHPPVCPRTVAGMQHLALQPRSQLAEAARNESA